MYRIKNSVKLVLVLILYGKYYYITNLHAILGTTFKFISESYFKKLLFPTNA